MIANQSDSEVKVTWVSIMAVVIKRNLAPRFACEIYCYVTDSAVSTKSLRSYLVTLIGDHCSTDEIDLRIEKVFAALCFEDRFDLANNRIATVIDTLIDIIGQSSQRFRGLVVITEQVLQYQYPRAPAPDNPLFAMIPGQPANAGYGYTMMSRYLSQQYCLHTEAHLKKLSGALVLGTHSLSINTLIGMSVDHRPCVAELTKHSDIRLIMVPGKDGDMTDNFAMIASRQRLFGVKEVCITEIYLMPCRIRDPYFRYWYDLTGGPCWRNLHDDMIPDRTAKFVTIECGPDLMNAVSVQLPTAIQSALDQMKMPLRTKSAHSAMSSALVRQPMPK